MGLALDEALGLCAHLAKQQGHSALLDTLADRLREARERTDGWLAYARCVTDYDAACEVVEREGR